MELTPTKRAPTPAQEFCALACGVVLGAIVFLWLPLELAWAVGVLVLAGVAAVVLPTVRLPALVVAGCAALLLRGAGVPARPADNFFTGPQVFRATVVEPPRPINRATRYVVQPAIPGLGRVLVVASPFPAYQFGDTTVVSCPKVEVETFAGYTRQGVYRECAFPELQLVASAPPGLRKFLISLRAVASARVQRLLPRPYAPLTTGMLWGDDALVPPDIVAAFRRTGTSHVLAVSGYNVMVLVEILFTVLIGVGLWRRQASLVVLAAVIGFVVFTGAEASVVRAGIMGSLVVLARLIGRRADKPNLLLGAAAAMLIAEPSLLLDLGFELSFAAMAGLFFVAPRLTPRLRMLPEAWGLREAVSETLAATITTTPIILWYVGSLPTLSSVANVLIGPVIFAVFALGLPMLALSFVALPLTVPFAWALSLVLAYVTWVVTSLGALPWATAGASAAAWSAVAAAYVTLAWWLYRQPREA